MKQPSRTFTNTSPTEELQHPPLSTRSEPSQEKAKDLRPEPIPGVRVRYVVSGGHLIHQESAQHMVKSATSVETKIILVLNVGPNSQEEGTDGPAAHPEDRRAKANINNPGREVTR